MSRTKSAAPLFLQALGLVLATLLAAWVASGVVIFMLPPPAVEVYRVGELAESLTTRQPVRAEDGRTIAIRPTDGPIEDRGGFRQGQFKAALAQRIGVSPSDITLDTLRMQRPTGPERGRSRGRGNEMNPVIFGGFRLVVRQQDGTYLKAYSDGIRFDSWQSRSLLAYFLAALVVAPLAWLFTRRLTAPIAAFAKAAERLGRDPRAPPLEMKGSSEVNDAVEAFNRMQSRLTRYVEDRTAMIGAIAHDMRTPLTRLRFRVESAPEDVSAKMVADIDQMDQMISAALAFVRDATQTGERSKLELSSLVESVVDEMAETGAAVTLAESQQVVIDGDSLALRRLLSNLIDNAVKYGGAARVKLSAIPSSAVIEVEDDGPGVPPEEIERLFEPFYRHEPSRSRETGGIGLGLAVVRSIARTHGGDVTLHNRPGGGLVARVMLPM